MNIRNSTISFNEAFYLCDVSDHDIYFRPPFTIYYERTNEVNVNLAMIKLSLPGSNIITIRNYTFRNVARSIESKGLISTKGSELKNSNFAITSSISLTF